METKIGRMARHPGDIAEEILFLMTGREKSIFANMDEKDLPYVRYAFDGWLTGKITGEKDADEVIRTIWKKLGKTHRIRRVK
jgi:hypothetical protein